MAIYYPVAGSSKDTLANKILIIPSVSLANLPQLAVDLLITSLGQRKVGYVGTGETVVPFFGRDEDGIVTGGLEDEKSDIVVIQQRSPTIKSLKDEHVSLLSGFVNESRVREVLLLTSLDAANQDDIQLQTPFQHIIPPSSPSSPLVDALKSLPQLNLNLDPTSMSQSTKEPPYPPFLPGAGLTRRLLSTLPPSVPHAALSAWCVEGDNKADAHALAELVLKLLGRDGLEIREPESWKGLFGATEGWSGGTGANAELYG